MADANDRTCTVYGLYSSADERIRYVGQTTGDVATRVRKHVAKALRKTTKPTHREAWIRKVVASGAKVKWVVLQQTAIWNKDEILWIRKLRRRGADLVNATRGGEGMLDAPQELRDRIAERLRALWADPAYRQRMQEAHKGVAWSEARKLAQAAPEERSERARRGRMALSAERRSEIASLAAQAGKAKRAAKKAAGFGA